VLSEVTDQNFPNSDMKFFLAINVFILSLLNVSCIDLPYYKKEVRNWRSIYPDSSQPEFSVYLIGDAGSPSLTIQEPTLKLLEQTINGDTNSAVIFLGDNIYFDGMPASSSSSREKQEAKLIEQLKIFADYKGQVFLVAGNHDWDYMKEGGLKAIKRQEAFVENYLNRDNSFVPDNACPGPFTAKIHPQIAFAAIDSQWWLHKYIKPYGPCGDCAAEDEDDMIVQLKDFLDNNKNRHKLIVAHHPLYSNGNHGGYYTFMDYVFPLSIIRKNLYVPLPGIGAIYPLYRKFGGVDQDISHYKYQYFKSRITSIIGEYDNLVYAAGHDHNLQLHSEGPINHVVSGAGSRLNPVSGGGNALYTQRAKGFARINYYHSGQAWIEYWIPEGDGSEGTIKFRHKLYEKKSGALELFCSLSEKNYQDSSIIMAASSQYKTSKLHQFLFGNHYRKDWIQPITIPYVNLSSDEGGLIPYGIGGGKQSKSLKLKNLDGRKFVLRSINKNPTKAIPATFRNTIVQDLAQDQISAQHPYGSLVAAKIAEAVGIYHNNPRIVYIPNDSCLGPYREEFKGSMSFLEEDANDDHSNVASLGYSKNIVGTDKVFEEIEEDNDNIVDQRFYLRTRLTDMLMGDWDRHERQFRWTDIPTEKGKIYRVIPEDRDQVFYKFDGVLPTILSRKWAIRNLRNFDYQYGDIVGLNLSAKNIDRRFLSALDEKDWIEIADSIRKELSDKEIEEAVKALPDSIYPIHGPEITAKLKSRRNLLPQAALKYYHALNQYTDIYGSDKDEHFTVERIDDSHTRVTINKINKEGEISKKLYERTFKSEATREIRLYGLAGEDKFVLKGDVDKGIKIRIIGGKDKDTILDFSKVDGCSNRTFIYDTNYDTYIQKGKSTSIQTSFKERINFPGLDEFKYKYLGPQATLYYNPDDGFYIGAGVLYQTYKFRSLPYGASHKLMVNVATHTRSRKLEYTGEVKNFIKKYDLYINALSYAPAFVFNFFGYGNETPGKTAGIDFYRVRLLHTMINPALSKSFTSFFKINLGPLYEYYKVEDNTGTLLSETLGESNPEIYKGQQFLGLRSSFVLGTRDNIYNPTRGILLTAEANISKRLTYTKGYYRHFKSEFIVYITPNLPKQLTLAMRIGGASTGGDFEFYQGNSIGLTQNVRGYRKTRFIGDDSFYQNVELRGELFNFNAYIFPAKIGLMALFDNGRVYVRGEKSREWHTSYGPGIWMSIYDRFVMNATYAFSEEDQLFNFRLGFFY
jgi:hypothetical protein